MARLGAAPWKAPCWAHDSLSCFGAAREDWAGNCCTGGRCGRTHRAAFAAALLPQPLGNHCVAGVGCLTPCTARQVTTVSWPTAMGCLCTVKPAARMRVHATQASPPCSLCPAGAAGACLHQSEPYAPFPVGGGCHCFAFPVAAPGRVCCGLLSMPPSASDRQRCAEV